MEGGSSTSLVTIVAEYDPEADFVGIDAGVGLDCDGASVVAGADFVGIDVGVGSDCEGASVAAEAVSGTGCCGTILVSAQGRTCLWGSFVITIVVKLNTKRVITQIRLPLAHFSLIQAICKSSREPMWRIAL